jgi:hypothetical protein
MRRLLMIVAALTAASGAASAQVGERLDEAALAGERGGIKTDMGLEIGFGATVSTFIDGKLALQSKLTWTPTGPATEQSAGGPLPQGVTVAPWTGSPLTVSDGATVIMHALSGSTLGSIVANAADNRNIRQTTDITLALPQLPKLQQQMAQARTASQLQTSLGDALIARAGR